MEIQHFYELLHKEGENVLMSRTYVHSDRLNNRVVTHTKPDYVIGSLVNKQGKYMWGRMLSVRETASNWIQRVDRHLAFTS